MTQLKESHQQALRDDRERIMRFHLYLYPSLINITLRLPSKNHVRPLGIRRHQNTKSRKQFLICLLRCNVLPSEDVGISYSTKLKFKLHSHFWNS